MKRNKLALAAASGMIILALVFSFTLGCLNSPVFVPPLNVIGDVETVLHITSLEEMGEIKKIRLEAGSIRGVPLQELLAKAGPREADKVYLVAQDGFTVALDIGSLQESYLTFSSKNGWELVNLCHPPSSNVKMIQEIIVVAEENLPLNSFTLVDKAETMHTTVGRLYTRALTFYPYFEGRASLEHEGQNYASEVYTRRRVFKLGDLIPIEENAPIILFGEEGGYLLADDDSLYELAGNRIDYIQPEAREKLAGVRLAVVDPPAGSIMDVYYDARHYLENGESILILLLEGLTYSRYEAVLAEGRAPFLRGKGAVSPALGLYPFEASLWLKAMLTGFTPAQNKAGEDVEPGIDLFDLCKASGKQAAVLGISKEVLEDVEGQFMVQDSKGNGRDDIDNEIYEELQSRLLEGYSLIITCFHSLETGRRAAADTLFPDGREAMGRIDGYIQELASFWPGKIIITALPSSSRTEGLALRSEDLFVPYMLLGPN